MKKLVKKYVSQFTKKKIFNKVYKYLIFKTNKISKANECRSSKKPFYYIQDAKNSPFMPPKSGSMQLYTNVLPGFSFGDILLLTHRNIYCTIISTVPSSN